MWRLSYRISMLVSAVQYRLRRFASNTGQFVIAGIITSASLGIDTTQTLAYQIFTLLTAIALAAAATLPFLRLRVTGWRRLPRAVTAGESFAYTVTVGNIGSAPLDALVLIEELADPRPSFEEFRRLRFPTYRGFWRLMRKRQVGDVGETALPALSPGNQAQARLEARTFRRGVLHFDAMTIARPDALGLFRSSVRIAARDNLLVLPKRYVIPPLALPGSRMFQQGGVSLAASIGDSEEFVGLRDYRPGDPLQRVHWKSFARMGRPIVKEYQDEFFERHALVLDTFGGETEAGTFEEAVSVAASFACTLDTQECLLDLLFVGDAACCYTAGRGQLQPAALLEALAGAQLRANEGFHALRSALMARRASLTTSILVLIAWDEPRRHLVRELRAMGLPLLVMAVLAQRPGDAPEWLRVLVPGRIQEGLAGISSI
jgi:uncharacterized protein (DUF58 family)